MYFRVLVKIAKQHLMHLQPEHLFYKNMSGRFMYRLGLLNETSTEDSAAASASAGGAENSADATGASSG